VISERAVVLRILDANFNRLREALRVIEETERFCNDNRDSASLLKSLRDLCREAYCMLPEKELLAARNSAADVGRASAGKGEMSRTGVHEIAAANFKRAEEAARVVEEYSKIINSDVSRIAKELRYSLYDLEKNLRT